MDKRIDLHEEIARVAHDIYEKRGGLHGSDLDDWLQAEKIVMQNYKTKSKKGGLKSSQSKRKLKKKGQRKVSEVKW